MSLMCFHTHTHTGGIINWSTVSNWCIPHCVFLLAQIPGVGGASGHAWNDCLCVCPSSPCTLLQIQTLACQGISEWAHTLSQLYCRYTYT